MPALAAAEGAVKAAPVNEGVDATLANLANGTYKIQAPEHMYTKGEPTGLTKAFLDFMISPVVQNGPVKDLYYGPYK